MKSPVPPWLALAGKPDRKIAELRRLSPEERLERFVEACALAEAILENRADAAQVRAHRDPLSPEAQATWRRLIREARSAHP
ncbi:MAG: hypothetical protein ACYC8T_17050 [Myxococcaceae bacterium]